MAGSKIVGITIDIEGKNDGLVKSLKEVDQQLGKTKSALSDVDKALKIDPKNLELLTQKQELLTKQIQGTSDKLKIMKQVAEDAKKGLEAGTVTKEQYAKLTAEVAKTEKSLEAMNQAAEQNAKAMKEAQDGTSDMNDALKVMDDNLDKTERALKTVDAALRLDPTNTELVATKQELLAKQVEQTKDKLDLMKTSAEKAAEGLAKGTTSKEEYAELTAKIATTEKELSDLEKAANPAADALNDTGDAAEGSAKGLDEESKSSKLANTAMGALDKATGGLASSLASLAANPIVAVIAALTALVAIAKKVIDTMKKVASVLVDACVEAAKKFAQVLKDVTEQIDKTMTKLGEFTKEGASYADEVMTMADQTGLATDEIQRLMYVAELVDVSVETMTGSMTKLEKSMASATDEASGTGKTFKDLGVQIRNSDGTFRKANDVFYDVIKALSGIDDEVLRDTTAMSLLGKSAKDLNPLINKSAEELDEFNRQAQESGYILSGEVLEAYGKYDDALQMLDKGTEALSHGLGLVLLPALTQVAQEGIPLLNELTTGIVNANGDIEEIGKVIDSVVPKALDILVKNLPQFVEIAKKLITTTLTTIKNNLPEILNAGIEIVKCIAEGLLNPESIKAITDGVNDIVTEFVAFVNEHSAEIIDLGVGILTSLISGLTQTLPTFIEAIAELIVTLGEELTKPETLDAIIDAACTLFEAIVDALDRALPQIMEALPGFIQRIANKLLESDILSKIIEAGITIFSTLLDSGVIDEVLRVMSQYNGQIMQLMTRIFTKMIEIATETSGPLLDFFSNLGTQLALNLAAGLLGKIPFIGETLEVFFRSVSAAVPGGGAYSNLPGNTNYTPNNNNQPSGLTPEQQAAIGAGEDQFYHPSPTPKPSVGTMSLDAMSVYSAPGYDQIANRIVEASRDQSIVNVVYIGDEKVDTVVSKAQNQSAYISGGRF